MRTPQWIAVDVAAATLAKQRNDVLAQFLTDPLDRRTRIVGADQLAFVRDDDRMSSVFEQHGDRSLRLLAFLPLVR